MSVVLVAFALEAEARPFRRLIRGRSDLDLLVTGMGQAHARKGLQARLDRKPAAEVWSCGFAGALDPNLPRGAVVFSADPDFARAERLLAVGARPVRFHCADRVAATAQAKADLLQRTGAQAVEMESAALRALCQERAIPSATVRVISDEADEDLPLDFNLFVTAGQQMNYLKLAFALCSHPAKLKALLRFQRQVQAAASGLAQVLAQALAV